MGGDPLLNAFSGMGRPTPRMVALLSLLAAGLALGVALGSEYLGGLVPCALCLWERVPYRLAIALACLALLVPSRILLALLALAVVVSAGLAAVHVGVEQGLWPSPLPECATRMTAVGSIADRLAAMPALPAKPCDEPSFLIAAVPVSMAAMNLLFALAFAGLLAIYLVQPRRPRP